MFTRPLLFAGLILFATHLFAGTRDPNTPDHKYLEFGKKFPSVVRLIALTEITDKTGEIRPTFQHGSAVIIRPHWALTAAHVVKGVLAPTIVKESAAGEQKYPLTKLFIPKEYDDDTMGFYDVALCYSPEDFNLKFYTPLYTEQDELGKAITIAGYGLTGTFHTGCQISDGKKRGGHNKIEATERAVLVAKPSVGRYRLPLEFMIAPGDSGGGMFIGDKLAGINSFLMAADKNPNGTYGDESAFTRVSLYVNWIESQIEQYELALAARATTGNLSDVQIIAVNIPTDLPALVLEP